MHIRILLDRKRARQWHRLTIEALRAAGHRVEIDVLPDGCPLPAAIALLLTLERLIYGRAADTHGGFWQVPAFPPSSAGVPDLTIDLTGQIVSRATGRVIRTLFSGSPMEEAGYMDLLNNRAPQLAIQDSDHPFQPSTIRIAVEDPFKIAAAMDYACARLMRFLLQAVAQAANGHIVQGTFDAMAPSFAGWSNRLAITAVVERARGMLNRLTQRAPHWHVGWRRADADSLTQTLSIPRGGWTRVPDDRQRFFADPFAIHFAGKNWLFVEEFPYATGKGVISRFEMGANGPIGTARPVLELPHHLSYPFIFEHDDQMWMIPESSAVRRVELYRARAFPDQWELAAVLLDGEEVSDATVVSHSGRWWMFGTVSGGWQSSWDTLKIWTAESLFGPWEASGSGPALVDAMGARPAGAFFLRGGELWRPAQDCSTGYGAGLVLARVDRLDRDGFGQTMGAHIRPNSEWPGLGIHTLNSANGLEVVDGCTA